MASINQFRLRDYQDPLGSYEHNILLNLGIHNPGRYAGYDTMHIPSPGLECYLRHTNSGYNPKKADGNYYGKFGVWITQQGLVVGEAGDIGPLTFDTNAGNTYPRYDLVVGSHTYTALAPGQTATYAVIKGPVGNGLKPILADPSLQVALGYMKFAPGATTLANAQWQPAKSPDSGDYVDAALYETNKFTKTQNESAGTVDAVVYAGSGMLSLLSDGNTFPLAPVTATEINGIGFSNFDIQSGLKIAFMITQNIKIKTLPNLTTSQLRAGYKRVVVPAKYGTAANEFGTPPDLVSFWELTIGEDEVAYISMELIEDEFLVTNVVNAIKPPKTAVPKGISTFWFGIANDNFTGAGVGINDMLGWYVLNGSTYTLPGGATVTVPDLRGRNAMGATDMPSDGAPALDAAVVGVAPLWTQLGAWQHFLSILEMPSHGHPVIDPGHLHNTRQGNGNLGGGYDRGNNESIGTYMLPAQTGITLGETGGNNAHNNRDASYAGIWVIKLY